MMNLVFQLEKSTLVMFITLADVDWVQKSWVTYHMSWVTCAYLLDICLELNLISISLGSQSFVHISQEIYSRDIGLIND